MTSSSSNRSNQFSLSAPVTSQRFSLHLVVVADDWVLSDLSRALEKHVDDPGHLIGVVGENMRVGIELSGIHPHRAERLARSLIRQHFVLSLSGRCFNAEGRETFGIRLFSPSRN